MLHSFIKTVAQFVHLVLLLVLLGDALYIALAFLAYW